MDGPLIAAFNATLARISAIDKEIAAHDNAKIDLQRERAALLHDLDRTRDVLAHLRPPESISVVDQPPQAELVSTRKRPIRQSSSVGFARGVLRTAKRDMYIDEIISMISKMYGRPVSKSTLVSNLSRYVKAHDTFRRSGPNVYGLIENVPSEVIEDEEGPRLML